MPTGETEFNFQVGNFNFHSELHLARRLRLQGPVQGHRTVNGVSGYDFTLTAYDGDISRRRRDGQVPDPDHEDNTATSVFDNKNGVPS